ncbi:MAG TPA: methyltransferase domain-containing protein [Allosphingosinicella sp.]|nr:methyltransferase domain-containing protein [Allosphingosinicella sp.]
MASRSLPRAALALAGIVAAGVLLYFLLFPQGPRTPAVQPGPDFDPGQFVQGRPRLDVPYIASDLRVVDAMLAMAAIRPGDYVLDLGSGDGRILIAAARSNGARGLGVDIDPARIRESNLNARDAGVANRVTFRRQDLFQTPLAEADVVTLYLLPEINLRLRPRILNEMRAGTRVVSHDYDMGDWRWDERRRVDNAMIYMWIVPARVTGAWTLTENGRSQTLALTQEYQTVGGTLDGVRVEQGRLTGDQIRFIVRRGGGRRIYEGRISGTTMAGEGWRAARAP